MLFGISSDLITLVSVASKFVGRQRGNPVTVLRMLRMIVI